MLAPLVPLVLVMAWGIDIVPAFLCGIIWLAIFAGGGFAKKMNMLTKTAYKGVQDVAPVIWLLVGIGILVRAVMHPVLCHSGAAVAVPRPPEPVRHGLWYLRGSGRGRYPDAAAGHGRLCGG